MGIISWSLRHRLYRRVKANPETGCLLWQGALSEGYGKIGRGERGSGQVRTHVAAWELANGPVPAGMMVLHKCHVRNCIALEHLYIGTAKDNANDIRKAKRGANQYGRFYCQA